MELDVFGLSYHEDRQFDYNERNPGLGLTLVMGDRGDDFLSILVSGGTYKDSFYEQATFLVAGVRAMVGSKDSFHASMSIQGGYFEGSGFNGLGALPVCSVGYDRYDFCVTGNPFETKEGDQGSSRVVAFFLKVRVLEF